MEIPISPQLHVLPAPFIKTPREAIELASKWLIREWAELRLHTPSQVTARTQAMLARGGNLEQQLPQAKCAAGLWGTEGEKDSYWRPGRDVDCVIVAIVDKQTCSRRRRRRRTSNTCASVSFATTEMTITMALGLFGCERRMRHSHVAQLSATL